MRIQQLALGETAFIVTFGTPRAQHYCYMCWHCHRTRSSTLQGTFLGKIPQIVYAANDVFAAACQWCSYRYCWASSSKQFALFLQSIRHIHASLFPGYSKCPLPLSRFQSIYTFHLWRYTKLDWRKSFKASCIELSGVDLRIKYSKMEEFFNPVISGILQCIAKAMEDLEERIKMVYLVGGFGGCPYLYKAVTEHFGNKYTCYSSWIWFCCCLRSCPFPPQSRHCSCTKSWCYIWCPGKHSIWEGKTWGKLQVAWWKWHTHVLECVFHVRWKRRHTKHKRGLLEVICPSQLQANKNAYWYL